MQGIVEETVYTTMQWQETLPSPRFEFTAKDGHTILTAPIFIIAMFINIIIIKMDRPPPLTYC